MNYLPRFAKGFGNLCHRIPAIGGAAQYQKDLASVLKNSCKD
jgi:hypothetical protein